ncbi:hypothetical protein [Lichenicola sp.]|uniref:hypothetical protein n=1 Tax=Lichenicola sp. TaxID=2804529 RepID=UPI003AFFB8D9
MTNRPAYRVARRALVLLPLLAAASLAGCGGGSGPPDPVGEWTGTLVTDKGTCPDQLPSRLLVGSRNISFIPSGGVLVLHGTLKPAPATLHAQLMLSDMNHKPLPMVFEGTQAADGSRIDGTYGTPSCRAHILMVRPVEHPFERVLGH